MTVKTKICGLTNTVDAQFATDCGTDILGFIFTDRSPRYISVEQAKQIVCGVRDGCSTSGIEAPKFAGVFVDEEPDIIQSMMDNVGLDYAQLHGSESPAILSQLSGRAYKAIRPRPDDTAQQTADPLLYASLGVPGGPGLLVDAFTQDAYGGTGELTDWRYAAQLAAEVCGFMLAGGLTPENVQAAIKAVKPWAVDVSSGVESGPGRKDHDAVNRFIVTAQQARV
jgi:phosphoribosylanthranilate isomerase